MKAFYFRTVVAKSFVSPFSFADMCVIKVPNERKVKPALIVSD